MPEFITTIIQGVGSISFLIGLIVLWKIGLLKYLLEFKKNGNGNGVSKQIQILQDNHIAHLENKIDKLIGINQEILFELRESRKEHTQFLRK